MRKVFARVQKGRIVVEELISPLEGCMLGAWLVGGGGEDAEEDVVALERTERGEVGLKGWKAGGFGGDGAARTMIEEIGRQ